MHIRLAVGGESVVAVVIDRDCAAGREFIEFAAAVKRVMHRGQIPAAALRLLTRVVAIRLVAVVNGAAVLRLLFKAGFNLFTDFIARAYNGLFYVFKNNRSC